MSIAVNSLTGPAMLNLPSTFERSGIIPTTFTLVLVCILSALCCMHMANTISKVPGNNAFEREVEFSAAFQHFWGERWFVVTQVLFFCCITCLNISSIVDTGQVVDTFFGHWCPFGAVAYRIFPSRDDDDNNNNSGTRYTVDFVQWDYTSCSAKEVSKGTCRPFRSGDIAVDNAILLSTGDLVTTLIFLPLALMDLKENSMAQIVGFLVLLATSVQFVFQFALSETLSLDNASWWGSSWRDLFGVVLFNFALVIVVPAWLYERESHVNVATVIHGSSALSLLLYVLIGILGDLAMPHVSENMLESMMSGSMGVAMQLGASIFAFFIIGLGIPLFSVLTRLNLTGSGLVSRPTGNVFAVFLPFLVGIVMDGEHAVTDLLSWGGLIFTGMVVFVLPLLLTMHVAQTSDVKGSVRVYFGYWEDKPTHLKSLYILLALTSLSLVVAIAGLIMVPKDVDDRIPDIK
jgi:hypothetical protein